NGPRQLSWSIRFLAEGLAMRGFLVAGLSLVLLTAVRAAEPADVTRAAITVLKANCYRCHGQDGQHEGKLADVLDVAALREKQFVVSGDAARSRVLQRVLKGQMPPPDESPRPTPAD